MSEKLNKLEILLKSYKKVIVAFSGGIDSSFLLYFCVKFLGKENVLAVTGVSETYTKDEFNFSREFSDKLGVKLVVVETNEFNDPNFFNNPKERCYYCKSELYSTVTKISAEEKIEIILDGTTASDAGDYRPGKKAAREHSVKSPLVEVGFLKEEIREILKENNLSFWNKPANPCLASRVPYNNKITKDKLLQIEKGERFLRSVGFNIVRVRHHSEVARIEIPENEIDLFLKKDLREKILGYFKSLGFTWITLDLQGYRTGSLNEILVKKN